MHMICIRTSEGTIPDERRQLEIDVSICYTYTHAHTHTHTRVHALHAWVCLSVGPFVTLPVSSLSACLPFSFPRATLIIVQSHSPSLHVCVKNPEICMCLTYSSEFASRWQIPESDKIMGIAAHMCCGTVLEERDVYRSLHLGTEQKQRNQDQQ